MRSRTQPTIRSLTTAQHEINTCTTLSQVSAPHRQRNHNGGSHQLCSCGGMQALSPSNHLRVDLEGEGKRASVLQTPTALTNIVLLCRRSHNIAQRLGRMPYLRRDGWHRFRRAWLGMVGHAPTTVWCIMGHLSNGNLSSGICHGASNRKAETHPPRDHNIPTNAQTTMPVPTHTPATDSGRANGHRLGPTTPRARHLRSQCIVPLGDT